MTAARPGAGCSPPGAERAALPPLRVIDLGRMEYRLAWALQKEVVAERHAGRVPDTLLFVEHEPVITLGRGARGMATDVLSHGAGSATATEVIEVERGGAATWHGPGQLVAYPVVALRDEAHDLRAWLAALEQAVIETLADLGLPGAGRREGATGVWIDGARKLASIGVAASRWVTWHGLALNLDPELSHFAAIRPCGFDAEVMTSVARETGRPPDPAFARERLAARLGTALAPFRKPT